MIEGLPKNRPDAECVLKNPFFWKEAKEYFTFLERVHKYQYKKLSPERRTDIENGAIAKLFTSRDKSKNNWLDFLRDKLDVCKEIEKYLREEGRNSKSIFDLVELILEIVSLTIFMKMLKFF